MNRKTPYYIVGILFVALFLGLVGVSKLTGLWVEREGHGEPRHDSTEFSKNTGEFAQTDESQSEIKKITEHFSGMRLSDFCQITEIDSQCAISKLGLSDSDLTSTFSEIATRQKTTIAQMMKDIQDCGSILGRPEKDFDSKGGGDR